LRLFSFGGYGLALAALALVVFGAYDSYPTLAIFDQIIFALPAPTVSMSTKSPLTKLESFSRLKENMHLFSLL